MSGLGAEVGHGTIIRVGGASLIGGAVAFMAVFAYLAVAFGYPQILDGTADAVLPRLLATGTIGRAVWALYAFLPLVWVPAGVAAFHALRPSREGSLRVAMLFALLAALAMTLGLLRWPSVHWRLAEAYAAADPGQRAAIAAVFSGLNSYLGNYVGEFLGELAMSLFFLLSALAMLAMPSDFPPWMGRLGVTTAAAGLVGMFRNITDAVAPVAALNNYLLPLWMIVFGIGLWRYGSRRPSRSVG